MSWHMRERWGRSRETFWFIPALMSAVAVLLATAKVGIDRRLSDAGRDSIPFTYAGGPDGARALLATIGGSMVTVAGVTFSITIAALALASSQFGPRLTRNFIRDAGNQIVLGTFIGTFIYCLLVLRTVRGPANEVFVPHLSVTIGVALAVASLGVLIYFIHHASTGIQAASLITTVGRDLDAAMNARRYDIGSRMLCR